MTQEHHEPIEGAPGEETEPIETAEIAGLERVVPPAIEDPADIKTDAERIFKMAANGMKGVEKRNMISSSFVSNVPGQAARVLAATAEKAGENERALTLFEESLDQFLLADVSKSGPARLLSLAVDSVENIARLGGDTSKAIEKLKGICDNLISPEAIYGTVVREDKAMPQITAAPRPSMPNNFEDAVKLLPDSAKIPKGMEEYAEDVSQAVQWGIREHQEKLVQGLANAAATVHEFGKEDEAQKFLDMAIRVAQLKRLSLKGVMTGVKSTPLPEKLEFSEEEAFSLASALWRMGREEESLEFALTQHGSHDLLYFLCDKVPDLLKSDPKKSKYIKFAGQFLSLDSVEFLGKDMTMGPSIQQAKLTIALILRKEYNLALPENEDPLSLNDDKKEND